MRSLRARLVVAFALVAVVPVGIALLVLTRRIQDTVRTQASERLDATLSALREQIRLDGDRSGVRLRLLAADPELKRMVLVPEAAPELAEFLSRQRRLLGLDLLGVIDTAGHPIADAADAPRAAPGEDRSHAAPQSGRGDAPVVVPLRGDGSLAVVAGAPVIYRDRVAARLWGGFLLDSARLADAQRVSGIALVLRDAGGRTRAASPGATPFPDAAVPASRGRASGSAGTPAPGRSATGSAAPVGSFLARAIPLDVGPPPHPELVGVASTESADRAVAALRITSLIVAAIGLGIAVALGALGSWQVSRPVERIARFAERIARGAWDEPLRVESVRELGTLVDSLERMRTDLAGYRERLVAGERHAAWSLMARQIAHEVRNPLTPIAVSVADLKRTYEQHREDFPAVLDQAVATIGDEVRALKALLQEFSQFGRFPEPRPERMPVRALFDELAALYAADVADARLRVEPADAALAVHADRDHLRQALVNLIQNGLEAVGDGGHVTLRATGSGRGVVLDVADDGPGLDPEQRAQLFVPHFTTKAHGSGLGLAIVERIVSDHGGSIRVDSAPGRGTTFHVHLPSAPETACPPC